jgi:enoyl-CoA hydratase/carnithine racemase
MGAYEHEGLRVDIDQRVAFVTIDHPPVNLFDAVLIGALGELAGELADDDDVGAVVVRSADPEFFIAHADLGLIQALPRDRTDRPEQPEFIHVFMERWRTLPQITIAQLEGRARGGGSEFALSLDLRFGAIGRAILGQPEVAVGILPGGSGTQRLPRLMGRSRALEVVLGCADFDAELAERYGWINRALPAAEIGPFVERLARRIAAFPPPAVRLAKRAVDAAGGSLEDGLLEEAHCFNLTLADPQLDARMEGALAAGAQTREGEMDLPGLIEASLRSSSAG